MGSSQPDNGSRLPFGYLSEDPNSDPSIFDFLPDPPPDPAPGNPILTTAEENGLANILAGIVSNGYGEQNFGEGVIGDEWMMPPNLMGTATSFGLHPQISMPDHLLNNNFFQTTTPQTFATNDSLLASAPPAATTPNGYAGPGPSHSTSSSVTAEQEAAFSTWIYGSEAQQSQRNDPPRPPVDLQYGTDQSFNNNNQPFVPSSEKDSSEAIQKEHMRYFSAIELSKSADTTRPTSPVMIAEGLPFNLKTRVPPPIKIEANGDGGKKWRKGKREDEEDDEEPQSAVSKTSARKRKQKGDPAHSPDGAADGAGSGKRRKSSAAAKRENLTEDQKRENHINSEKKRRKVIQTGFENLAVMVPAIKGGNPSKSAMLEAAVAWLEELLDGNEALKAQLSQL
ncbi:putative bhlh family transcription factor [Diaporthe ampelina]|uniref:Putative bhlh family transcription factor n=1 Tax=Diaporthe ampelina TaxID=1214573 RepID=A0A0G2FSU8_9PEZI|nr:putative bhlh family transcription factor [Diaporthe ampelina]